MEVVLAESDSIVGGIPGFLLSMKNGTLLPNCRCRCFKRPTGMRYPAAVDPALSAVSIRDTVKTLTGKTIAVIIADSRTHAMRLGCSGVAIGCAGIP